MKLVEVDEAQDAVDSVGDPKHLWVEPKFNGWHIQVVNGRIWSRRGKDLTLKFREIGSQVARYKGSCLLGELVYWGPDGIMDEPAVTHVAGTKNPDEAHRKLMEMPGAFQLALFDMIADDGVDLSQQSLARRRARLERVAGGRQTWEVPLSPTHPFRDWPELYKEVTSLGGDGVVFKNEEAKYYWRPLSEHEARPMGVQFKLKPSSTDDFAVTGTHYGKKGRLILELSQYHDGELVFVSEMSNIARDLEPVFERRARRAPFVVEVEFQSRFPDPPGALQHPRLVRVREDKGPEQTMLPERYAP
jgi:ATP-dependent DNA ligase